VPCEQDRENRIEEPVRAKVFGMNRRLFTPGAVAFLSIACAQDTPTSSSARIVDAGWSFGFCIGPCRGELQVDGTALALRVTDRTGSQVIAQNRGRLTSGGSARLAGAAASLPEDLPERFGCPDCADGGASWLTVARESGTRRTEYEHGNPPAELAAADQFLMGVMQALRECRATADLTLEAGCTPVP
jgi:hypothetical protein